jgi:hypothetical protein
MHCSMANATMYHDIEGSDGMVARYKGCMAGTTP